MTIPTDNQHTGADQSDEKGKTIALVIEEEIELLEYVSAILANKYKIAFVSLTMAIIVFAASYLMPVKYEAVASVAFIQVESLGGVQPDNRRAPEMVSLLEHDFLSRQVYENHYDRLIAQMRSRVFTEYFIVKNDLLPIIFHKQWNKQEKKWKEGFEANMLIASRVFRKNISAVEHNKDNNLLNIRISLEQRKLTARLANQFVEDFNTWARNKALEEADAKLAFLQEGLKQTNIVEMKKSFYRLMEAQLVDKMLANSKKDYAIEMLDPAFVPIDKSSPARKKMAVMAFILTFILSIIFIISRIVLRRVQSSIRDYREKHQIQTVEDKEIPVIKPFHEDFDDD
jgi:LPS O-antigen subunit length determinant protein (WzzB/FepE family)